jgi:hypothetical protein
MKGQGQESLNVDLGSEFGASRGQCVGPFLSLTCDPTLQVSIILLQGINLVALLQP